jgi:DNA-binding MarR family transcriptional regulator/GNAT superfamily N-acetyltransferase
LVDFVNYFSEHAFGPFANETAAMLARQIEAARRFNRFYTQRIGVLDEGLLDSPFSLTEVRVMYELAHRRGIGAAELAHDLGIDKGYLSRILKRLRGRNWLARSVAGDDARRHVLALTASGRRAFAPLEHRSQQQMRAMLAPLASARRQRVLDAMRTIEHDLGSAAEAPSPVVLRAHRPGDIGWVVQRHGEIYWHEYGWNEDFEALVAGIAAKFIEHLDPERERCWIAERDGVRLGCIFLVAHGRTTAKLRLLLVEPEARGLGLGKRLIDACLAFARDNGYKRVVLWTQDNLDAARHLYERAGFRRTRSEAHLSFGKALVAETWALKL